MRVNDRELFKKAFIDANIIEMRAVTNDTIHYEHTFSLGFETKVREIINGINKKQKHLSKKKLIIAIVAATILVSILFSLVIWGDRLGSFILDITSKSFDLITEERGDTPETIETEYHPTYLPDGFVLNSQDVGFSVYKKYTYTNENRSIIFEQSILANGTISVSKEKSDYDIYQINGNFVYLFEIPRSNTYVAVWEERGYSFYIEFPSDLGVDEVLKIIESLAIKVQ